MYEFKNLVLSRWQTLDFPILADAKADPGDVVVAINHPSGGKKKLSVFTGNRLLIIFFLSVQAPHRESNSGQQPCRAPTMGP